MFGTRSFWAALFTAFLFCMCCFAVQNAPVSAKASQDRLNAFLDQASSLPIEYRADLIFSLINQLPHSLSDTRRRQLVLSIMNDAAQAKYKTPLVDAVDSPNLLPHQTALNLAWLHLDTLEIQLHALALFHESQERSFHRLQSIRLQPTRATCDDATIPDYAPYYRLVAQFLNSSEIAARMDSNARQSYLSDLLSQMKAPSQLAAFLQMYPTLRLSLVESDALRKSMEAKLASMTPSDREMVGIEGRHGELTGTVKALLATPTFHGKDGVALLAAYRAFLISGLHGEACAGSTLSRQPVVQRFNDMDPALIGDASDQAPPLTLADVSPTHSIQAAGRFEVIAEYRTKQEQMHRLFQVFVANQRAHDAFSPGEDYAQPEPADVREVLEDATAAEPYTNDQDSALLKYENRQSVLMLLVELLPPGPSFHDAIDAEAAFLNLNPIEQSDPPAWLRAVKELILISRTVSTDQIDAMKRDIANGKGLIMLPSPDAGFIHQTLRRYPSDRIISAYVAYEELVRPPYVTFPMSKQIW